MNTSVMTVATGTLFSEDAGGEDLMTTSATVPSLTDTEADFNLALLASHPLFQAAVWVYKVTIVVIFLAGVFGNTMILILQRRIVGSGRDSGMSVFVSSLAVSDSAMLFVSGVTWCLYSYGIAPTDFHDVFCKMIYWLLYVIGLTSPWILVAMTLQRAASIQWPHRVNAAWTARKARATVAVIVLWAALLNSHCLYGRGLRSLPGGQQICLFASDDYRDFFNDVWPSVDIVLSSFVPSALLVTANAVLVRRVRQATREARETLAAGSGEQLKARQNQASGMTLTLVCVSLAFLLLTSPLCVFFVVRRTGGRAVIRDVNEAAKNFLAEAAGNVLWLANNAINFYIYALTGSRYRAALARMCGCLQAAEKGSGARRSSALTRSSDLSAAEP